MMPTLNVVFGVVGHLDVGDAGDCPAERVNRIGNAECAVAVAAGPLVRHAIAIAPTARLAMSETGAVHRDEVVDLSLQFRW